MLYELHDVSVSLGAKTVLSHIDFGIRGTEKIGITGANGAGKTTLLRLIAGELDPDRDDRRSGPAVLCARSLTIKMHRQHIPKDWLCRTVEELAFSVSGLTEAERYSRERYDLEQRFNRLFTGLGLKLEEKSKKVEAFSGGQQTRIALILSFLSEPDILLLDEPTNHLDLKAVEWLEDWLNSYPKAVVIVSHDRYFLDRAVSVVWEVEDKRLTRYAGGYTAYRQQKEKNRIAAAAAYARQEAEVKRLSDLIARFKNKPKKASFARAKKTILERMEKLPPARELDAHRFTEPIIPASPGSKWVLETKDLCIGYGKKPLCPPIEMKIQRGMKIGILGDNGVGKTTLLAVIAGVLPKLSGKMTLGNGVTIGYFDQQASGLQSEKTVFEHFSERFPGMDAGQVKSRLAAYLFRGNAVLTRVDALSGGEKSRLVLAEILEARPNFLVLDEPTNHMDIPAKETLESALEAYTGTILFVSHDRYLIRRIAKRLLVMGNDGSLTSYPFGYEHYVNHLKEDKLPSLRTSKEQAMIDGLRAVPKAERHERGFRSEEEAWQDWRLNLALKDMNEAAEAWAALYEADNPFDMHTEQKNREDSLKSAQDAWTQACLTWYDIANSF